jgi:hypothetical protein
VTAASAPQATPNLVVVQSGHIPVANVPFRTLMAAIRKAMRHIAPTDIPGKLTRVRRLSCVQHIYGGIEYTLNVPTLGATIQVRDLGQKSCAHLRPETPPNFVFVHGETTDPELWEETKRLTHGLHVALIEELRAPRVFGVKLPSMRHLCSTPQ